MVDCDLAAQPFCQSAAAVVMETASSHINGLDAGWRRGFYSLIVAVADNKIVTDYALEWGEREHVRYDLFVIFAVHIENETIVESA